jgi:branched-chain amino acid transport system ATP-binding protein
VLEVDLLARAGRFELQVGCAAGQEVLALVGPSGAGKSLTLQCIAGLHRPQAGRIALHGRILFDSHRGIDVPARARRIGYVVQHYALFPHLTVAQNLRLGAWPYRRRRDFTHRILEHVVDYFPRLRERWNQVGGTLSGGEQQMLAIARGLMARPKLLLIDEASLGLSPVLTQTVFEVVRRINEDGTTVLMVEQNAGAIGIASRALVMEKGTIVYQGAGDAIVDHSDIRAAYLGAPA